ncbi:NB-ARC domain-containing protein [Mycolicibacterium neoaurum]|uniref:Regulatory protein AfsR n=1 Tax=Mycolicibacterium neoaurum TaxID=1795 RepID=A0AAV2WG14_MYCNE|nr:NB-ARC domain-containing protein [Mycolicibacterium neoaurum]TLH50345.1 hypothetical protein C1S81_20195 [Mycolicibacterium neoaurum]CDQ43179.1 Regulatory protein AfsR [Mycolicibacterium neoaurum]
MAKKRRFGRRKINPLGLHVEARDNSVAAHTIKNFQAIYPNAVRPTVSTAVFVLDDLNYEGMPFVARENELSKLKVALHGAGLSAPSATVISGPPGIGKTELAKNAARDLKGHFKLSLFVDLRGYDAPDDRVGAVDIMRRILPLIGVSDCAPTSSFGEQLRMYHEQLDLLERQYCRILLIADNVSDLEQVLSLIPRKNYHQMVVTTRETFGRIPKSRVVNLKVLQPAQAGELLAQSLSFRNPGDRRIADTAGLVALASLCDCTPLVLQIAAALMADEPERPADLFVDELRDEESRLDQLHYDDQLSFRAAVAMSFRRLDESLCRLFVLMSLVPGGDVSIEAAARMADLRPPSARAQLMSLVRSHLVVQHVDNRWSMHDLIRLYAAEKVPEVGIDQLEALKRLALGYFDDLCAVDGWRFDPPMEISTDRFESAKIAWCWIEENVHSLVAFIEHTAREHTRAEPAVAIGIKLFEQISRDYRWALQAAATMEVFASLLDRIPDSEMRVRALAAYSGYLDEKLSFSASASVLDQAAEVSGRLGRLDMEKNAQKLAKMAREKHTKSLSLGSDPETLERRRTPGYHAMQIANTAQTSLSAAEQSVEMARNSGDAIDLADSLNELGTVLIVIANENEDFPKFDRAKAVLSEAVSIYSRKHNKEGRIRANHNLGMAMCATGEFDIGIPKIREAISYFELIEGAEPEARGARSYLALVQRAQLKIESLRKNGAIIPDGTYRY